MNKKTYSIALLLLTALLTACNERDFHPEGTDETSGKTPIQLSVGVKGADTSDTRAITIKPSNATEYRAFDASTTLYMIYKSEDLSTTPRTTKYSKTMGMAMPVATPPDGSSSNVDFARDFSYSTADKGKFMRYWDDAYARETALSVYSICFPGCNSYGQDGITDTRAISFGGTAFANQGWNTTVLSTTISWQLDNQNVDNAGLSKIDLCYSNNISKYTDASSNVVDKRLKFGTQTAKKFDSGEMVFYHMTSKFTFVINKGDGFTSTDPFAFATNTNIKLTGFNYRVNNLDVATGDLASGGSYAVGDIPKLWEDPNKVDGSAFTVRGLVFPTTDMNQDDEDAVIFTINNNEYHVNRKDLYEAIKAKAENCESDGSVKTKYLENGTKLKAGVHYVFTFTVGKTKIDNITATIVDWETVTAEDLHPSNARIKLLLEERGVALQATDQVDIYRTADNASSISDSWESYKWTTGYTGNKNVFKKVDTDNDGTPDTWKLNNDWYWNNNQNYYHFRAIMPVNQTVGTIDNTDPTPDEDYVTLTSGDTYTDVRWGAPMLDVAQNEANDASTLKWFYGPETKGFDCKEDGTVATALPSGTLHQIYKAIGPTENQIKLILFHMMSDVTFKVKTTTGADAVSLGDGTTGNATTIELQKIHKEGRLFLGNGLVLGSTSNVASSNHTFAPSSSAPDANGFLTWANYGAIPQALTDVVLVITTPDHNQYKVAMKGVLAAASNAISSNNIANPYSTVPTGQPNAGKYIIDRWYPGYKYTYTFTLKKTGVTDIQATIVEWETVTADEQEVQIQ